MLCSLKPVCSVPESSSHCVDLVSIIAESLAAELLLLLLSSNSLRANIAVSEQMDDDSFCLDVDVTSKKRYPNAVCRCMCDLCLPLSFFPSTAMAATWQTTSSVSVARFIFSQRKRIILQMA